MYYTTLIFPLRQQSRLSPSRILFSDMISLDLGQTFLDIGLVGETAYIFNLLISCPLKAIQVIIPRAWCQVLTHVDKAWVSRSKVRHICTLEQACHSIMLDRPSHIVRGRGLASFIGLLKLRTP